MPWLALTFEAVVVAIITVLIFRRYGRFELRYWYVAPATVLGWFITFSIVYLIPAEIAATRYEVCQASANCTIPEPLTYAAFDVRTQLWRVTYWVLAAGTWLIFPILQGYSMAGEFHVWEKLWGVIRLNLIWYAITAVVGIILLVWMLARGIIQESPQELTGILIALGNAWGMFLLVIFMGYGLVELPRSLWWHSNRDIVSNYHRFRAVALHNKVKEVRNAMVLLLAQIKRFDENIRDRDPLRPYINTVIAKCHLYGLDYEQVAAGGQAEASYADLVALHRDLIATEHNWRIAKSQYDNLVEEAIAFEDVQNARSASSGWEIYWSLRPRRTWPGAKLLNYAEYTWHVLVRERMLVVLCLLCAAMSLITLWSEVTFFSENPVLSVWALLIGIPPLSEAALQVLVFFVVVYMTYCSYSTLFNLEMMTFFRMVPNGHTDPNSLLFCAAYLARLFYPLCYNILFVVRYATDTRSNPSSSATAFVSFMGVMNQVPLFGAWYFQLFFPVTVVLVVVLVLADLHKRILGCFTDVFEVEEDFEHSSLKAGKELLEKEKAERLSPSVRIDSNRILPSQSASSPSVSSLSVTRFSKPSAPISPLTVADGSDSDIIETNTLPRRDTDTAAAASSSSSFWGLFGRQRKHDDDIELQPNPRKK